MGPSTFRRLAGAVPRNFKCGAEDRSPLRPAMVTGSAGGVRQVYSVPSQWSKRPAVTGPARGGEVSDMLWTSRAL